MKRSKFSEELVISILKEEHEAGLAAAELCRKDGMSSATFCSWKAEFGGHEFSDVKKALEEENARLKRLLAEAMLDNAGLLSRTW
jgi:putative transposase